METFSLTGGEVVQTVSEDHVLSRLILNDKVILLHPE